jgi:hypothetical protein
MNILDLFDAYNRAIARPAFGAYLKGKAALAKVTDDLLGLPLQDHERRILEAPGLNEAVDAYDEWMGTPLVSSILSTPFDPLTWINPASALKSAAPGVAKTVGNVADIALQGYRKPFQVVEDVASQASKALADRFTLFRRAPESEARLLRDQILDHLDELRRAGIEPDLLTNGKALRQAWGDVTKRFPSLQLDPTDVRTWSFLSEPAASTAHRIRDAAEALYEARAGAKNPDVSLWKAIYAAFPELKRLDKPLGLGEELLGTWRDWTLLRPGYHVVNFLDNLARGAISGVRFRGSGATRNLGDRLSSILLGRGDDAHFWLQADDLDRVVGADPETGRALLPKAIAQGWQTGLEENATQQLVKRLLGDERLASAAGRIPLMNRQLAENTDAPFRYAAYRQVVEQVLNDAAKAIGLDRPLTVEEIARQRPALTRHWANVIRNAVDEGVRRSNDIYFDYRDFTNLDRVLKAVFAFPFWTTRALPWWFRELRRNPALAGALAHYVGNNRRWQEEQGLPESMALSVPLARLNLGGREGTLYGAPLSFLSILENIGKLGTADDPVETLGAFGLSPQPLAGTAVALSGLMGDRMTPSMLPTQLPNAVLSLLLEEPVNLEAPLRGRIDQARAAFGQRPFDLQDYLLRRRLAELSIEDTGKMAQQPYLDAIYLDSPTRRRAERSLAREQAITSLLNWLGIPRTRFISDTEQRIRHDQRRKYGTTSQRRRYARASR